MDVLMRSPGSAPAADLQEPISSEETPPDPQTSWLYWDIDHTLNWLGWFNWDFAVICFHF